MVYISDLQQLISSWTERMGSRVHPSSYTDALSDCIYDLNSLISKTFLDEMTEQDARDYLDSIDADYLSHLEQEKFYATAV